MYLMLMIILLQVPEQLVQTRALKMLSDSGDQIYIIAALIVSFFKLQNTKFLQIINFTALVVNVFLLGYDQISTPPIINLYL